MFLANYKELLVSRLLRLLEVDSSEVLLALLLGIKFSNTSEVLLKIKTTGMLYFFVISGLHFALLDSLLSKCAQLVLSSTRAQRLFVITVLGMYATIVGWSVPVLRTVAMSGYTTLGSLVGRATSKRLIFIALVGGAALAAPFQEEPVVLSVSFLLSFGAVAALLFLTPRVPTSVLRGRPLWVGEVANQLSASVAVNVILAPLLLHFFGMWNPLSIFFSVLFAPFVTVLVSMGMLLLLWESVSMLVFSADSWASLLLVSLIRGILVPFFWLLEQAAAYSWQLEARPTVTHLVLYYFCLLVGIQGVRYATRRRATPFL